MALIASQQSLQRASRVRLAESPCQSARHVSSAAVTPRLTPAVRLSSRCHHAAPFSVASKRTTVQPCRAASPAAPSPTATPANHKLLSKVEIPAFIPRDDLMDQLYRWAVIETGDECVRTYGLPIVAGDRRVIKLANGEDMFWGFTLSFFKEGKKLGELSINFDDEAVVKHEWVDRGPDGFPVGGGKTVDIKGKNLEIWKVDANPVTEELRASIKLFCTALVTAVTKYYSFGSVWSEEI